MSVLRDLISAHVLRFERPDRAPSGAVAGTRLLTAFVLVGLLLQPALRSLARAAGVEVGKSSVLELFARVERHDVGVAELPVLASVLPLSGGAGLLEQKPDDQGRAFESE